MAINAHKIMSSTIEFFYRTRLDINTGLNFMRWLSEVHL